MLSRLPRFLWPACCAVLMAGFVAEVARFYHPVYGFTSLLQFDATNESTMLPEARDRPVFLNHRKGGYDGLYYAQLACRPSLRDPALGPAMDGNLVYRARRILVSGLAWVLALGDATRAIDIYTLINPLCWLGLAGLLFMLFPPRSAHDVTAWVGLLFSAGVLASVRLALIDLPALLLITGAVIAVQRGRLNGTVGLLAAASLTRETSLLAAPVLAGGTWRVTLRRAAFLIAPLAVWLLYIRIVVGPGNQGWGALDWPGAMFVEKWRVSLAALRQPDYRLLNATTVLALLALTVQAGWLIIRPQPSNLGWRLGIGYVGLLLLLGSGVWEGNPGAAARVLLPLNLAFNLLAPRTRAGLALLILANLTVPAGLLQLNSLPNDGVELAAARAGSTTVLVQTLSGWSEVERDAHNFWSWSSGDAVLVVRTNPAGVTLGLGCHLRSLTPRTVVISQGGRELWEGRIGPAWRTVSLACTHGEIQFHTDAPPVAEGPQPGARALAFCIEQVTLSGIRSTPATNIAPSAR
jgi:hypothetical protein